MDGTLTLAWKRAIVLFVGGMAGALAILPYQLALLPPLNLPLPLVIASGIINSAIFVAIAVAVGNAAAPRAGLGTPLIDAALTRGPLAGRVRAFAGLAIALGIGTAILAIVLDAALFAPLVPELSGVARPPVSPAWAGLLATFYGGITEEILLRYGLMSVLAWLITRAMRGPGAYWIAIVAAAVLFGLGHLPATAQLMALTPAVVARAIVLGGLLGVATGWLYWRHGLESAMVSHAAADLVLHVALPALASTA